MEDARLLLLPEQDVGELSLCSGWVAIWKEISSEVERGYFQELWPAILYGSEAW